MFCVLWLYSYLKEIIYQLYILQEKLSEIFPEFKITVAKKADAIYPIVSAASICAKVSRDRALKAWTFQEGLKATSDDFGSGYPNGR